MPKDDIVVARRAPARRSNLSKEIAITDIGAIARDVLVQANEATVMGVTSRGMFLLLHSGWVVFLSHDIYHGPLTLNYHGDSNHLNLLKNGQIARLSPGRIAFPEAGLLVHTGQAVSWEAPSTPQGVLLPEKRQEQLRLVARQLLDRQQTSPISVLLPFLLGWVETCEAQDKTPLPILVNLQRSLQGRQSSGIAQGLEALLGMGSGLTPSGDDLTIGFLLALRRWGHVLAPDLDVGLLGGEILPYAYRRTTTLSANLIDCALRGQANERLILALDGILSGNADPSACAATLAGWGNTSGLDAFLGMALAMRT